MLILFLLSPSTQLLAQWNVISHTNIDSGLQTRIATIENEAGFKLEIYRDANDAIRSRFSIRNSYDLLASKQCPTFQVDHRKPNNRSINDAPCILQARWAEYIMGYIDDDRVLSSSLLHLMNGHTIYYRFLLKRGNYGETSFSLSASKGNISVAIGSNLLITTDAR